MLPTSAESYKANGRDNYNLCFEFNMMFQVFTSPTYHHHVGPAQVTSGESQMDLSW